MRKAPLALSELSRGVSAARAFALHLATGGSVGSRGGREAGGPRAARVEVRSFVGAVYSETERSPQTSTLTLFPGSPVGTFGRYPVAVPESSGVPVPYAEG